MSKETIKAFDWKQYLEDDAELIAIIPTELKTPWLCHVALRQTDACLSLEFGEKHVPEHMRDAVNRLYNWEEEDDMSDDEEYLFNQYSWKTPYQKPFNETGAIDVSSACIVCGGTPDGTISKNYFAINGLDCCDNCFEEHIKRDTRQILLTMNCNGETMSWRTGKSMPMTSLVKPNTKLVQTKHPWNSIESSDSEDDD